MLKSECNLNRRVELVFKRKDKLPVYVLFNGGTRQGETISVNNITIMEGAKKERAVYYEIVIE